MLFKKINREVIQSIHILENNLMNFNAFRCLWADLVANHADCGISKEKLEEQQIRFLQAFIKIKASKLSD